MQFLLTIDIQQLLCTVMLHVVKEAVQSSSSLPFITNFKLFVNANKITDFSTHFIEGHDPNVAIVIPVRCLLNRGF